MKPNLKLLARIHDAKDDDVKERVEALRLQARAWRIVAMIALVDKKKATGHARWLMMVSVPYVDGEAVGSFVRENEAYSIACGRAAKVVV